MLKVYQFRDAKGDLLSQRAFLAETDPAVIRAAVVALKADVALHVMDAELPPGNVATLVEHDYSGSDTGAEKVPVGVWRHDERGGYWHAPYVDYRFDVEVWDGGVKRMGGVKRVAGEALDYLSAFMLASRETAAGASEAYVLWHSSKVVLERVIAGAPVGY